MRTPSAAIFFLFLCLFTGASAGVRAQQGGATQCPTVTVSCPSDFFPDKPWVYTAHVGGGDPSVKPTYKWSVSKGRITAGQGTARISVDSEGGDHMTATVEVGGYPSECVTSASCSLIVCPPPMSRKFDEYGDISLKDEQARLSQFAAELKNAPASQGYVMAYGGRRGRAGGARSRGARAKSYLVRRQGLDVSRIVVIDGGLREGPTVELFLTPVGAVPPSPSPTVFVGRKR